MTIQAVDHLPQRSIELRGVRVHNLKSIDLSIPLDRLTVVTGVSGSGKSSLAFDTLFAEGQRRFLESLSASSRQWLTRLEKPDAERIDRIPPAFAVRQESTRRGATRATVGTITEIHESLQLLFSRIGVVVCPSCGRDIRRESPESVQAVLQQLPAGVRFQIGFAVPAHSERGVAEDEIPTIDDLRRAGFARIIQQGQTISLTDSSSLESDSLQAHEFWVIIDRLTAGRVDESRLLDGLGMAFRHASGRGCIILVDADGTGAFGDDGEPQVVDERAWRLFRYSEELACGRCRRSFPNPEPRLFSYQSPLGACPECRGTGCVSRVSASAVLTGFESVESAISAAATSTGSVKAADELRAALGKSGIPLDLPSRDLSEEQQSLLMEGSSKGRKKFAGLAALLNDLESRRHQPGVRTLLKRWTRTETCPACGGERLQPGALAVRLPVPFNGTRPNLSDFNRFDPTRALDYLSQLVSSPDRTSHSISPIVETLRVRLRTLLHLGLEELSLGRPLQTVSSGEAQRVSLAAMLSTSLVRAMYVLDEPTAGLHAADVAKVLPEVQRLCRAPNTVVVVEHEDVFVRAADSVVELGPAAGPDGGQILFSGTPSEFLRSSSSVTAEWMTGRREMPARTAGRQKPGASGWIRLSGCRVNNLQNVTADFPLGALCVITGISGAGKTSLVSGSLFPALKRWLRNRSDDRPSGETGQLVWLGPNRSSWPEGMPKLDVVVLVDHSPLPRSLRSTPATCLKIFDLIRRQFAETADAQVKNYGPQHFSFNAAGGGRCPKCEGTGVRRIDMQFLADVTMPCPDCRGTRFQREILEVRWRGLNIAEVMALTVRDAVAFFSRHPKIVRRLQPLRDVGLDYLPLGQPVTTLSGGECRRLKLAMHIAASRNVRTLFLLEEPTTGLHRSDVAGLIPCLDSLLVLGHSLVVIEHSLDLIRSADWIIDLGPGAGTHGGHIVAAGAPAEIAACDKSVTGRFLRS